jgi:DNA invertase Pin-like site-specific DNA recombinase
MKVVVYSRVSTGEQDTKNQSVVLTDWAIQRGYEAVKLWWRYANDFDEDALVTLLEYNREDVVNLKTLKERLP